MKIKILFYQDDCNGPGHVALKAWEPRTPNRYWINFTKDFPGTTSNTLYASARDANYDADPCTDYFEFSTSKKLDDLINWHRSSGYYDCSDYRLLSNNCAHAVYDAMEFLGYDMSAANGCKWTSLFCCMWIPTTVMTPRAVYAAAKESVYPGPQAMPTEETPLLKKPGQPLF